MAEVKWIKIVTDIFDDEKILLIEGLPEADSIIVIWFKLLCLAGKQNNCGVFVMGNGIPYTEPMLATIFRRKEATVKLALKTFEQFGMIEIVNGTVTIPNWDKHQTLDSYEKKRERDRLYQAERREKQRLLAESPKKSSDKSSDVAISEEDIDKEEDENNTLDDLQSSNVEAFYESIWQLYPRKVGKGAVSKTKKQVLYRVGYDEMKRAIERYQAYIKAEGLEKQFVMHGSTFFNSGYVDYLDKNYEQPQSPPAQKPRKGHLEKITNAYGREEEVWREDE